MAFEMQYSMRLDKFADLNPPRPLKKGAIAKLIDMAALPTSHRSIELSSIEKRPYSSGARFKNGDSLLARITPCLENGKSAFVNCLQKDEVAAGSTEFIVIAAKREIEADFVYYASRLPEFRQYAISRMEGTSGRQRVSHHSIADFEFPYIGPEDRVAIGRMLRSLDDRIDHNRALAANLEAIARRLFKSWFVDFDPVRAKAAGEKPAGLADDIAALFPDQFVDSELGEIPQGWGISCLKNEFDLTMGQSPPGETYNEVGVGMPFYQGRTDFQSRYPTRRIYCTAPTRQAKMGDTLISVRAPVGDINMASEDCAIGRGVAAVRHKTASRSYTFEFMKGMNSVFARFEAEGTVFGSISKKDFQDIPCVKPPANIILSFEALLGSLDKLIEVSVVESQTIVRLRDLLLPRLISGKLCVADTESLIEEAIA